MGEVLAKLSMEGQRKYKETGEPVWGREIHLRRFSILCLRPTAALVLPSLAHSQPRDVLGPIN